MELDFNFCCFFRVLFFSFFTHKNKLINYLTFSIFLFNKNIFPPVVKKKKIFFVCQSGNRNKTEIKKKPSVNLLQKTKKQFISQKMFRCSSIFRNKLKSVTISDPATLFHSDPETRIRDKLIKEIYGGLSQTEVPALVSAADTYVKINQGMRKYSHDDDENQNQQQFNPELVRFKHSVLAPLMFHSYRKSRVVQGYSLLHCRRQFVDSKIPEKEIQQEENNREKNTSSSLTPYNQINSQLCRSSAIQSTFGGLVLRFQKGSANNNSSYSSSYLSEKHSFVKMKNDPNNESLLIRPKTTQTQNTTKKSDWEQKIFDIVSCSENEKIASYLLMEKIIREVLLPYIHHGDGATQPTQQNRLSISMKQLLLDTNLHKYSTCLGSHLVLEKELLKLGGGDKRCLKNYSDDDDGIALVAPGLIVSLKAKNWVQWMDKNSTRKVADLLFGKEDETINNKALLRKKKAFPLCVQPSLYDALVVNEKDEMVSKFRCDLLDLGYTLSSDLKEMMKI